MIFRDMFSSPEWWPTVLALLGLMLFTLVWTYARCPASWPVRMTCAGLKAAGVVLLGICLLEPVQTTEVPRQGANLFLVLADTSQSLQVRDVSSKLSRADRLRQRLVSDTAWQESLDQAFELRKFSFARQVKSDDYSEYQADGIGTSIISALGSLERRYRGQPVAGVLLFTDGNATDLQNQSIDWNAMPPVYPVVVGEEKPEADISISRFSVSQTNFEAAPITIAAELTSNGFAGDSFKAQLLNEAGELVSEKTVRSDEDRNTSVIRFKVRPEEPGISVYRLRVAEESQMVAFDDPEYSGEATMINNERTIMVDRNRGPYRILYVAGRPNWDFKFLRRAMQADDEIDLTGLIRIAREEPKFTFRSHQNETTNPLFRGFGNESDEEAERYDEPVLMRVGVGSENNLRDGFPKTAEELFKYQAIILDDVESGFFTEDQKDLINQFVTARGGGFLMLGGQETFFEGKYDRTPIGELLPVYLDQRLGKPRNVSWNLVLTREGWLQPWVRLEDTRDEEEVRLSEMPVFSTINAVRSIKPGASVLATVEAETGDRLNALVAQRSGKGRSAALLIGDFWRWHFQNTSGNDDMLKSWRQMLRWLIADVPGRVEVDVENNADANLSVQLSATVLNEAFEPLDNANVKFKIQRPDGTDVLLEAQPLDEGAGLFGVTYVPRQSGPYRVQVDAKASDGSVIGSDQNGWVSEPANEEFESLVPDRKLLEQIAKDTGGEVIELDEVDRLVKQLPKKMAPIMDTKLIPWWHNGWIFLLALGLLVSEWGLRRWKGLP